MSPFWQRLRERKLAQWGLAYLAGAWLLLQVVDILGGQFSFPGGVLRGFTVVLAMGFFAALVLAWYHGEQGHQAMPLAEFVMLSLLAAVTVGIVWLVNAGDERGPGDAAPRQGADLSAYGASVAVLPFDNFGTAQENDYFSEGVTEEIIRELAKVEGLKVISRTSVVALKGTQMTLPQIAAALGVRHVVEGSVRRAGDQVRITAQLIDPQSDAHLWTETYDRQLVDIFKVQEEIARHVSGALLARVDGLAPRGAGSRTEQAAAYDAYLRGTFARSRPSPAGLQTAMAAFEEAIAIDDTYAPAYAGLAYAHVLWTLFAYPSGLEPYASVARALALAERAVELDPASAEAWAARGHARLRAWMPVEDVLADIEQAVKLAPSSGEIRLLHGVALAFAGRFEEAVRETGVAVELDPLGPGNHDFRAMSLNLVRRYEEAIEAARVALALEPRFPNPRRQEARALLLLGRYDECIALDVGPYLVFRAMCLHSAGSGDEAGAIIESLAAAVNGGAPNLPLHPGALAGDLAEYHAWIGDLEGTLYWLTHSAEISPIHQFLVTETATYDRVRSEARFQSQLDASRRAVRTRILAPGRTGTTP
jgi:TolB-like protein